MRKQSFRKAYEVCQACVLCMPKHPFFKHPFFGCQHALSSTVSLPCILRVKRANMQASVLWMPKQPFYGCLKHLFFRCRSIRSLDASSLLVACSLCLPSRCFDFVLLLSPKGDILTLDKGNYTILGKHARYILYIL